MRLPASPKPLHLALPLAAVVVLAGCAQELSQTDVESSISTALAGQQIVVESVECPGALTGEEGHTMTCGLSGATNAEGLPISQVRVVVTSVEGTDIRYRLEPIAAP